MVDANRPEVVVDPALHEWLAGGTAGERELIVEARLPARRVRLAGSPSGQTVPQEIVADVGDRDALLRSLSADLGQLLGAKTTLLRSAGAVVVRASREQLLALLTHPLVRAVRPNRRLG